MSREFEKEYFGDSARNKSKSDLKSRYSNHVFDEAGENIQYLSDSESLGSRKTKTRYINPAIYIETVESTHSVTSLHTESSGFDDVTPHPHSTYRSKSTPLLSTRSGASSGSIKRISCRLDTGNIYCADDEDPTPRNNRTYRDNGADTFRLSVSSASTNTTAKEARQRNERKKQEAFQQWLARKEEQRREKLRTEKTKPPVLKVPSPQERDECFRRWLMHKQAENAYRKAEEVMRQYRDKRVQAEFSKKEKNNEEKFAEWMRKKEQDIKAIKSREGQRAARAAFEEARRRASGERAYRDWLRTSKYKPLPVPLNQGELSMRGSISEMYINPNPWQPPT